MKRIWAVLVVTAAIAAAALAPGVAAAADSDIAKLAAGDLSLTIQAADGGIGWRWVGPAEHGAPHTTMGWEIYPDGLHEILMTVHRDYGAPEIVITENGIAHEDQVEADGRIRDTYRSEYLAAHLEQAGRALADGAKVRGYCCWSLLDNLEWDMGWGQRFGLIYVDYQTLNRTVKDSGWWYRDVIRNACTQECME